MEQHMRPQYRASRSRIEQRAEGPGHRLCCSRGVPRYAILVPDIATARIAPYAAEVPGIV
eukprot:3241261-Rhodomonas_salina.2